MHKLRERLQAEKDKSVEMEREQKEKQNRVCFTPPPETPKMFQRFAPCR